MFARDIALLKVFPPLTFNAQVSPICIPKPGTRYDNGTYNIIIGFLSNCLFNNGLRHTP